MNFVEELRWRGMVHDIMPGTEEQLSREMTTAYVGIDPTAESLHIGHLVSVMLLRHFQLAGHRPIILLGGATGMIGDPSGKSEERVLISEEIIRHNQNMLKTQLSRFLDFGSAPNSALMVNNYDWMKEFSFLGFIRDIGKHISVSYMLSKDSVQKRLESGLSFTEFSYQLVQGYDFLFLYQNHQCKLQMGGSDQWGNILTGTELIRRKTGGEAWALTCPLITKADGSKFGKTESGNVWLDPRFTSPYKFYQFWLNVSDADAEKYIRIFTFLKKNEIEELVVRHNEKPHERMLQKTLAREVTTMVHSQKDYESAVEASDILFGKGSFESLSRLDEETFLSVFEGVPAYHVEEKYLQEEISLAELLVDSAPVFPSRGEFRRTVQGGGLNINKQKIDSPEQLFSRDILINERYMLVQKGKKNYHLVIFSGK